nr:hypothetical protein [Streptomyces sp. DSM 41633]
ARTRLQAIIDRFEERAAALTPHLDEPGVARELKAEAQRAIAEASAVVEELRAELDRQTGAVAGMPPAAGMQPSVAGFSAGSGGLPPPSSGLSGLSGASPRSGWSGGAGPEAAVGLSDPGMFGEGVAVRLPDGSTATAPN